MKKLRDILDAFVLFLFLFFCIIFIGIRSSSICWSDSGEIEKSKSFTKDEYIGNEVVPQNVRIKNYAKFDWPKFKTNQTSYYLIALSAEEAKIYDLAKENSMNVRKFFKDRIQKMANNFCVREGFTKALLVKFNLDEAKFDKIAMNTSPNFDFQKSGGVNNNKIMNEKYFLPALHLKEGRLFLIPGDEISILSPEIQDSRRVYNSDLKYHRVPIKTIYCL
jgi:hypothetical protein